MSGGGNTSSKGPSPTDPGIKGSFSGGDSSSPTGPAVNDTTSSVANSNYAASPVAGTTGESYFGGSAPTQIGFSAPFGADTTAISGVSSGNDSSSGSVFSTIANPSAGNPLSIAPTSMDNVAAGGTPSGGTAALGVSGGGASAAGLAPPSGAGGAPLSVDPTQTQPQQKQGAPLPAGSGGGGFSLENLVNSAEKSLTSNPLGLAAAGAGLYQSVMSGKQISDNQAALQDQAGKLNAQGQQMMQYLQSGNLPPGLKAGLDQATSAAKAKVISNYAAQGQNTDPSQNTALAQQLAMIDQQAIITTSQIGQQLYSSGVQESGLASGLYTTLANLDQTQTQRVSQAIASMASALNGGGKGGTSINIGK